MLTGALSLYAGSAADAQIWVFGGNDHVHLGGATLSDSGGRLVVSNIGSSGQDGVSIDLGESGGAGALILSDPEIVDQDLTLWGSVGGIPGINLGGIHLDIDPLTDTVDLIGVVPQTAGTYEFELTVTDNVSLTSFSSIVGGGLLGTLDFSATSLPTNLALSARKGPPGGGTTETVEIVVGYSENFLGVPPGGGGGGGRYAVVRITPSPGTSFDVDHLSSLSVTSAVAGGRPDSSQEIDDEVLVMFDQGVRALGDSRLEASGGTLTVSNIGSSGLDGVSIDLDPGGGASNELSEVLKAALVVRDAASGLPTGKRQHKPLTVTKEIDKATPMLMQGSVNGSLPGQSAPVLLYSSSVEVVGGLVTVTSDFSPVGSTLYDIEVTQNGNPIASGTFANGLAVSLDGFPLLETVLGITGQYDETEWDFLSRGATSVTLPGGSPTLVDGAEPVLISMRAVGVTDVPTGKTSVDFFYNQSGAGGVEISNINSIPEPSTLLLAGLGLLSVGMTRRRRQRA